MAPHLSYTVAGANLFSFLGPFRAHTPSSQKCDKVVEVGLWLPITQECICNNVDPL